MAKRRRWWMAGLLVVLLLVGAAAAAVFLLFDADAYRPAAEARLSRALQREVTIGRLRLSPVPFALEARDVRIADDPAFAPGELMRLDALRLHVDLWPLLRREVRVTSMDLIRPVVQLARDEAGQWNAAALGAGLAATAEEQEVRTPDMVATITISDLRIEDGRVRLLGRAGAPEQAYEIRSFHARRISPEAPFPVTLIVGEAERDEPVRIEGQVGPIDTANPARTSASGTLAAGRLHVAGLRLTDLDGRFALENGQLAVDPLEAGAYGGRHRLAATIDFREAPALQLEARAADLDVNLLLGDLADLRDRLFGAMAADLRLSGPLAGDEVVRAVSGDGTLDLADGRLAGVDLRREIVAAAGLAGLDLPGAADTPITRAGGRFRIAGGQARTDDLQLAIPDVALLFAGAFHFDGTLAFDVLATFSPELSRRMLPPADRRAALLDRLAVDEEGRAVIPLRLTGTVAAPRLALDAGRLRQDLIEEGVDRLKDLLKRRLFP